MELGKKIRQIRKGQKLSQGQLAQRVGINSTHLSRLETGRYQPSLDVLKKLAEALEVSVEHLVSENEQGIEKTEVQIRNKPLAERIRLIDSMEEADQQALLRVIDSMLTKQRMRRLLEESPVSAAS